MWLVLSMVLFGIGKAAWYSDLDINGIMLWAIIMIGGILALVKYFLSWIEITKESETPITSCLLMFFGTAIPLSILINPVSTEKIVFGFVLALLFIIIIKLEEYFSKRFSKKKKKKK